MTWIEAVLLVAHAAAILAAVLAFQAAVRRSLTAGPLPAAPSSRRTARPSSPSVSTTPRRSYDAVVSDLAELDRRHAAGEIPPSEHATLRRVLLAEAKRARRTE